MKPAAFDYHAPDSLDEALNLLAQYGDEAKPLAGGQSLVPAMNFRLAQPSVLVDLNRIGDLAFIRPLDEGGLSIGAMTRQIQVENHELVRERASLVAETLPHVAHPQIRHRGTFGGSIAHADPAAELPAVALAIQARLRIQSLRGERTIEARELFTGLFETCLAPDELLVAVEIPRPSAGTGWAFSEVARRHGDYALVGVAAQVTRGDDGRCKSARLALLSVGEGPVTANLACGELLGQSLDDECIRSAAATAAQRDIDPPGDIHASTDYRRHLAEVLCRRVLEQAWERAQPTLRS